MNDKREQAKAYLEQGSLCRAVVTAQQLVAVAPTSENLNLLGDCYLAQGLDDDAMATYTRALTTEKSCKLWIN